MSAPTNTTAATAINLGAGAFPITATQRVDDAGTTYTVWYSYNAQPNDHVLGIWGFGDLTTYLPHLTCFDGPAASPIPISATAINVPLQLTVVPGTTYYFRFVSNSGNPSPANLSINLVSANILGSPAGSFLINDDTSSIYPTAILSSTSSNYAFRYVNGVPASEQGDDNGSGSILYLDDNNSVYVLYTNSFTTSTTISSLDTSNAVVRANTLSGLFYVTNGYTTGPVITTISSLGVVGATSWTLTGAAFLRAMAPSTDNTILYYGFRNVGSTDIARWDLVNNVALTNLATGPSNYEIYDLYGLRDGTVLANFVKLSSTRSVHVLHYAADGTLLNTYDLGSDFPATVQPRISLAPSEASFWLYQNLSSTVGESLYTQVRISDGTVLATISGTEFNTGVYNGAATATPTARFGASGSCPLIVTKTPIAPPALVPGGGGGDRPSSGNSTLDATEIPIRRLRRFPHIATDNKRVFISRMEILAEPGLSDDDLLMIRASKDGGYTWSPERVVSTGALGRYLQRVQTYRWGQARDWVFEVSTSGPIPQSLLAAWADLESGTN